MFSSLKRISKEKLDRIGIVGQWLSGVLVGIGVGIEIAMQADVGYILITLGSLLYAAFTKLRKI